MDNSQGAAMSHYYELWTAQAQYYQKEQTGIGGMA